MREHRTHGIFQLAENPCTTYLYARQIGFGEAMMPRPWQKFSTTAVDPPGIEPGSEELPTWGYTRFLLHLPQQTTTLSVWLEARLCGPGLNKEGWAPFVPARYQHDADKLIAPERGPVSHHLLRSAFCYAVAAAMATGASASSLIAEAGVS